MQEKDKSLALEILSDIDTDIDINLDDMQEDLITELNDLQDLDFNIDD